MLLAVVHPVGTARTHTSESNIRRRYTIPLIVGNDFDTASQKDGHARVRRAKIDANHRTGDRTGLICGGVQREEAHEEPLRHPPYQYCPVWMPVHARSGRMMEMHGITVIFWDQVLAQAPAGMKGETFEKDHRSRGLRFFNVGKWAKPAARRDIRRAALMTAPGAAVVVSTFSGRCTSVAWYHGKVYFRHGRSTSD